MRAPSARQEQADAISKALAAMIPVPRCELDHANAFQLLVATILSAQSTDKGVNKVTPELFRRFPTPAAMAAAPQDAVESIVKPTGFFRQKAKNIREASRILVERHAGEVPRTMEALIGLPGVARKTANVVLGTAFGISSGVTVDTHAMRVSRRLRLTRADDPVRIERDLMKLFPQRDWPALGHRLVLLGRYTCTARKPKCSACGLLALCPSPEARAARNA